MSTGSQKVDISLRFVTRFSASAMASAAMEKQRFTELLDASLLDFRRHMLDGFGAEDSASSSALGMDSPADPRSDRILESVEMSEMASQKQQELEATAWARANAVHPTEERGVSGDTEMSSITPTDERESVSELLQGAFSEYLGLHHGTVISGVVFVSRILVPTTCAGALSESQTS